MGVNWIKRLWHSRMVWNDPPNHLTFSSKLSGCSTSNALQKAWSQILIPTVRLLIEENTYPAHRQSFPIHLHLLFNKLAIKTVVYTPFAWNLGGCLQLPQPRMKNTHRQTSNLKMDPWKKSFLFGNHDAIGIYAHPKAFEMMQVP